MATRDAKVLAKGLRILEELSERPRGMTASELAQLISVHKTSVYRYLNTLLNAGYIANDGTGHYRLANKILEIGSKLLRRMPLRDVAHPLLIKLSSDTQKTVHLSVLDGADVVYIDKVETQQTLPIMSRIGSRAPAYCTGVGKALLSALSTDQVVELIGKMALEKRTQNTIVDPLRLLEEIKVSAERGYAIDNGEHEEGIRCFAAPVTAYGGDVAGSVSVTGLERDFEDPSVRDSIITAVSETAREISRRLGHVE